jgi:hypothetical protein
MMSVRKYRSIFSVTSKSAITAVFHGTDGDYALGCSAEHALGPSNPTPFDLLALTVDRDYRRLIEDDPFTLHVDQGVRGAEVDTDCVAREKRSRLDERPAHPGC